MSKTAYYFSHDSNARNDERILAVRMRHKAEGYAIYFMILERLLESTNYVSAKDYNVIAFDLRVSAEVVKSVVEDFGLFTITSDGKSFYSQSFLNRMKPLDNLREQRREAGLKSAEKRSKTNKKPTKTNECSTVVQRPLPENPTKERKGKERIKSKEENILLPRDTAEPIGAEQKKLFENFQKFLSREAQNVTNMKEPFTIQEFLKLKSKFTSNQIRDMVLKMHNYKPLLKKNNSAYLTFVNWMTRDYGSETERSGEPNINDRLKSAWK